MRKIIFLISVLLTTISVLLTTLFCSAATYADNTVSKSGRNILSLENAEIEILEVGFCDEAQMGYTEGQRSQTVNGIKNEELFFNDALFTAPKGEKHFVLKAYIVNQSSSLISFNDLAGKVAFDTGDEAMIFAYPYQPLGSKEHDSIEAGASTPVSYVCTVPEEMMWYFSGCTVEIAGKTQRFEKDDIVNAERIAFPAKGEKNDTAQDAPVFAIEDCKIDEVWEDSFSFKAKIRNISDEDIDDFSLEYQVLDGQGDVLCSHGFILHNIAAGQGMWSFAARVGNANLEEVAAIRFVSATIGNPYKYVPLLEKSTFYINSSPSRDPVDDQESTVKAEPKNISLNDRISVDTVEFILESCEYRDEVRYTTASKTYSRVFDAQADGIKYYVVEGKIKNLLTEARDISKITATLKMDDTYSYTAKVFIINPDNRGTASSAEPLIEYKLVLYAAVPESFADGTHSGEWCFGFNDTFDKPANAPQDCDNVFVLEIV